MHRPTKGMPLARGKGTRSPAVSTDTVPKQRFPILEFDSSSAAVIEPTRVIEPTEIPEHAVVCFFQDAIECVARKSKAKVVAHLLSEMGRTPVYRIRYKGKDCALFHPGVGAPLAAGSLEEAIALGCHKFVVCGGAGVLRKNIAAGHIIVPKLAVRDEGTSYHYVAPGREVGASKEGVDAILRTLKRHSRPYLVGKTWTTDAFYRETPRKAQLRRSEGCLTVEMEASALFAVAKFRGVTLAQMLYGGDDISSKVWDTRSEKKRGRIREQLIWIAIESCLEL